LVRRLLHELPGLVSDRVHLLGLELHRAGRSLAGLVIWSLVAALCIATAWLALCGGAVLGLLHAGIAWPTVMLIVVGVNVLIAAWGGWRASVLAGELRLPATMRQLTVSDATHSALDDEHRAAPFEPSDR
jgi:Putative Actinobacterial Holin-X, holin superfamily III